MNLSALRRILDPACRIYSFFTLLLCFLQMMIAEEEQVIHPVSFFMLFPFALCFAGAELIRKSKSITAGLRLVGHFALMTVGVVFFVFLPAGVFSSGSSALVMVCTYLLLYLLIMLTIAGIKTWLKRKKTENTTAYSSQYANLREKK